MPMDRELSYLAELRSWSRVARCRCTVNEDSNTYEALSLKLDAHSILAEEEEDGRVVGLGKEAVVMGGGQAL